MKKILLTFIMSLFVGVVVLGGGSLPGEDIVEIVINSLHALGLI